MCSVIRSVFVEAIEMIKPIIKMFILILGVDFLQNICKSVVSFSRYYLPSRQVATECGNTLTIREENTSASYTRVCRIETWAKEDEENKRLQIYLRNRRNI